MTSDERIAKLERDLRHTRVGMALLAVAGAVAILAARPGQPSEIVLGDVKIDRSGVTIQASRAPEVRVELSASGLRLRGPHYTSTLQSSNLTLDGEHGTATLFAGKLAIKDDFGKSLLGGSDWQAVAGDGKGTGARFGLNVTESGAMLTIGPQGKPGTGFLLDASTKETILSGRNGDGSWVLHAGAAPEIYVTAGATTATLAPSVKP